MNLTKTLKKEIYNIVAKNDFDYWSSDIANLLNNGEYVTYNNSRDFIKRRNKLNDLIKKIIQKREKFL